MNLTDPDLSEFNGRQGPCVGSSPTPHEFLEHVQETLRELANGINVPENERRLIQERLRGVLDLFERELQHALGPWLTALTPSSVLRSILE